MLQYLKQDKYHKCNIKQKIPSAKRFGEGNGTPLQYSCLENSVDRGAWWAAVHEVAEGRTRLTSLSLFTCMHWRRKWQPTSGFLPGESQGWGSLVGCHLWGRTESDMTEATQQQQQQRRDYLQHAIIFKNKGENKMKYICVRSTYRLKVKKYC